MTGKRGVWMVITFVVGRGMGHLGRCISVVSRLLLFGRKVNVYGFPETHRYLRKNLLRFKRIYPYRTEGYRRKDWLREYGGMWKRSRVIVHDWRPEIVRYRKKGLLSPKTVLASLYHSDFHKYRDDAKEMKRFKEHIVSVASQTDVFFHMNVLPPRKRPQIDTLYLPVPIITRETTQGKEKVKAKLGLLPGEKFILVHMGGGLGKHRYRQIAKWYDAVNRLKTDYRIVIAGQFHEDEFAFREGVVRAPLFPNGKDLVNAADLVITKPGMGILSDCISLRKPLLMLPADNMEREQKVRMLREIIGSDLPLVTRTKELNGKIKEALQEERFFAERFSRIPTNGAKIVAKMLKKLERCPRKELADLYPKLLRLTPFR
ncbi:hypothetical protein BSNK01_14140 [Bacillaceae bacterium]